MLSAWSRVNILELPTRTEGARDEWYVGDLVDGDAGTKVSMTRKKVVKRAAEGVWGRSMLR